MPAVHAEVTTVPRIRQGVRNLDELGSRILPVSGPSAELPGVVRPLSQFDRTASAAVGVALTLAGLARGTLSGLALAGLGGYLLYRGWSGNCPVSEAVGLASRRRPVQGEVVYRVG
jgi:uncharacterized membrane protein